MRQLENLKYGKDFGTGEENLLVTQERMKDTDAAKVNANAKTDALDASDGSKIDIFNINVKIGIGKPCTVTIRMSRHMYC